jgi:hypothetical protein
MPKLRLNRTLNTRGSCHTLGLETLEARWLLAADVFAFQNPAYAMDVTHDSLVTPADALTIVNALNGFDLFNGKVGAYLDTTGDNTVAPNDVIGIVNILNGATIPTLDTVETEFEFAAEFLISHFDDVPHDLKLVAQQFIDATNDLTSSTMLRDDAISSFLDFSLDNNSAIVARYQEIEVATGVIDKEYRQDLQKLGVGLSELVISSFPNSSTDVDQYPEEYDFDPNAFDNIEAAFDDLFNEIDDVVGEIEIPDYGDVIDNFDEVFQTYDDTAFGLDEFVGDFLKTNEYDSFVLEGHDFNELIGDIGYIHDTGVSLDEFVTDAFGTSVELINVLGGMLDAAYIGELVFNDVVAIGGETTGSNIILVDGSVIEVDFGDDPDLLSRAETYANTNVLIEGIAQVVYGVEIPNRTVIDVRALVGQHELDALELLLLSDPSSIANSILSHFDGLLTS